LENDSSPNDNQPNNNLPRNKQPDASRKMIFGQMTIAQKNNAPIEVTK
jgi:hypothetical protein